LTLTTFAQHPDHNDILGNFENRYNRNYAQNNAHTVCSMKISALTQHQH